MQTRPTPEQIEKIGDALAAGKKIEAIRLHREATGEGLKESKDFIEALIPQLQARDPARYAKAGAGGKGCAVSAASTTLLAAGVAAAIMLLVLN